MSLLLQQQRERDQRAQWSAPATGCGQKRRQIGRLVAVASLQRGRQRPAKVNVCRKGQQKSSHELSVGNPQRAARIAPLKRQHIHKDGASTREQNVEWGCVFENQALVK